MATSRIEELLVDRLTDEQKRAVKSRSRRVLVVAGAGSGKTEVMARRIAWWVSVEGIPKDRIVAFTFTERAADEMKFRIRDWIQRTTRPGEDVRLGGMYVGTIHGYCLKKVREFWPNEYHNYDILDEAGRMALVLRSFNNLLGLRSLRDDLTKSLARKWPVGQYETADIFLQTFDQLNEHNKLEVQLPSEDIPINLGAEEFDWCKKATLHTDVGDTPEAKAFGLSAARYYAYLRCRRFLDFSTSQTEFIRKLAKDTPRRKLFDESGIYLVVDEVQDINPVQRQLMELLIGKNGKLTAVGDHRQAIYGFRGAKVEIIGDLWSEFKDSKDAEVVDLQENFRSTPRIIQLANSWAENISSVRSMETPPMRHGNGKRLDHHKSHVALIGFEERAEEAEWISNAIRILVPSDNEGAQHERKDGTPRGLAHSDIAVLVRSSTDVRTYMRALEDAGIPSVVRAGPDLYSQPEVLMFLSALAISSGQKEFLGSPYDSKSLPSRIENVLGCKPVPEIVLKESAKALRRSGLILDRVSEEGLARAARLIYERVSGGTLKSEDVMYVRSPGLRKFLSGRDKVRRVFPQQLFHFLLSEASVESWDTTEGRGQTAMFHLGALSSLITGIETPGWTSVDDYKWQIVGLCQYGSKEGRVEEQPLIVKPDAVTISTIHSVKGLEFAAVFLADVCPRRFPSGYARRKPKFPIAGKTAREIDVDSLADNENYDQERRLMYVALTRAERFLFISHSGQKTSLFVKELKGLVSASGGVDTDDANVILKGLKYLPKEYRREIQLTTSFSDLRYYLECPHDFYLRKVLGFSPTIDQAFGYGRGVHNLLRAIHADPKHWAKLAGNREELKKELQRLIDKGLFYLRYTTGEPADNMRNKGLEVVSDYVSRYVAELSKLVFEPEKEFETLVEYGDDEGGALVAGAIDIIRQDDPPRVTLIDFKTGDPDADRRQLDEEEMKLQVAIYGIAAKKELEYEPEQGLVRYLGATNGEKLELEVPLTEQAIKAAQTVVSTTARNIRDRAFKVGPRKKEDGEIRCHKCDFLGFCGMTDGKEYKRTKWAK